MRNEIQTRTIAVPVEECSICGARAPSQVHEAQSAEVARLQGLEAPKGVDLVVRSWQSPKGWHSLDLPSSERIRCCAGCAVAFTNAVAEAVERLRAAASEKRR